MTNSLKRVYSYLKIMKHFLTLLFTGLIFLVFANSVYAYGESSVIAGSTTEAPFCNNQAPGMPWPFTVESAGGDAVLLRWGSAERATSWTAAYGKNSGRYIWGISNFGNNLSRSVRLENLPAGRYYFVIRANNDCKPGPFSYELSTNVGQGGVAWVPPVEAVGNAPTLAPGEQFIVYPSPTPRASLRISPPKTTITSYYPPRTTVQPAIGPKQQGIFQRILNFLRGLFR